MVSVIVPVYKVEKYLDKCVQSIINQTYSDWEMILVDDGSPDNCGSMCDDYDKTDERIKVIHKENGGLSDARNAGVAKAVGDYVCFVDSDDYVEPNMLEVLVSTIGDCDMSTCGHVDDYLEFSKPQYTGENKSFETDVVTAYSYALQGKMFAPSSCGRLIKMDIAKKIPFQKGKIYEDTYYQTELMKHVNKVYINTAPLYHYFHREESITTRPFRSEDMDLIRAYEEAEQYWGDNPKLKKGIRYRLLLAYYGFLNRLLFMPDYKNIPEYKEILGFLKVHAFEIASNDLFTVKRRIAALIIKFNVNLYRRLFVMRNKGNRSVPNN